MLTRTELNKLKKLSIILGQREVYLYGAGFRNRCLGDTHSTLSVMIYAAESEYEDINNLITESGIDCFTISYCDNIIHETVKNIFTLDTLYLDVKASLVDSNKGEVESLDPKALQNLLDKELAFTDAGYNMIMETPSIILDSIVLASQHGLSFDNASLKHIFNNRHLTKDTALPIVIDFMQNIFYKSHKIRKGIAFVNTLGIAVELFGCKLEESAGLNHLNKRDISEFFTIIFSNIPVEELEDFLINKVGFNTWDIKDIINETKAIEMVQDEDDVTAIKILRLCGKKRLQSLIRLFKLIGYKTLSRKLKEHKNTIVDVPDLSIKVKDIITFFGVDENQAHKALDLALDYVMIQPQKNNKDDLLLMLNKQIESTRHA